MIKYITSEMIDNICKIAKYEKEIKKTRVFRCVMSEGAMLTASAKSLLDSWVSSNRVIFNTASIVVADVGSAFVLKYGRTLRSCSESVPAPSGGQYR